MYKLVDDVPVFLLTVSRVPEFGLFTLAAIDARDEDGVPVEIYGSFDNRINPLSVYVKPLEVIQDIEEEFNNAAFTESFFNTTEIEAEIGSLSQIKLLIKNQTEISEIVRQIQEGSSNRFRYEIDAEGKRTARLDNLSRASSLFVTKEEILETDDMTIYTDKDTIAATIKINWGRNGLTDVYQTVVDTSKDSAVAQSARERTGNRV